MENNLGDIRYADETMLIADVEMILKENLNKRKKNMNWDPDCRCQNETHTELQIFGRRIEIVKYTFQNVIK